MREEIKKVVINKCSLSGAWYTNMVGMELNVRETEDYYWAREGASNNGPWNILEKEDCTCLL